MLANAVLLGCESGTNPPLSVSVQEAVLRDRFRQASLLAHYGCCVEWTNLSAGGSTPAGHDLVVF